MRHFKAIGIKFIVISIVLFSLLSIFDRAATIPEILLISVLVTGAAYVLGDLFILPRFGNIAALIADFVLVLALLYGLNVVIIGTVDDILISSTFAAFVITASEAMFHVYMKEKVLPNKGDKLGQRTNITANRLQTEFAQEDNVIDMKKRNSQKE